MLILLFKGLLLLCHCPNSVQSELWNIYDFKGLIKVLMYSYDIDAWLAT